MKRLGRTAWACAGAGAAGIGLAAYWYAHRVERARVSLERVTVVVDKPGLPRSGLTILHLSDFHFRAADPVQDVRLARLRTLLASEQYDVLAFTGDLIHNEAGLPAALAFLLELRPTVAAFWVPGNRDYWESSFKAVLGTAEQQAGLSVVGRVRLVLHNARRIFRMFAGNQRAALRLHRNDVDAMNAALQSLGVRPLINCATEVRGPGYDVWIAGVDDLTQGSPNLAQALDAVPAGVPLVLLAHNPDVWAARALDVPGHPGARSADLVLSGHTHGGQINLPVAGAWYRQGTHLDRHEAAGWFVDGSSHLYVSRGLGESFPFRAGAEPQAALIRLVSADSAPDGAPSGGAPGMEEEA